MSFLFAQNDPYECRLLQSKVLSEDDDKIVIKKTLIKCLELTVAVIWSYAHKTEFKIEVNCIKNKTVN